MLSPFLLILRNHLSQKQPQLISHPEFVIDQKLRNSIGSNVVPDEILEVGVAICVVIEEFEQQNRPIDGAIPILPSLRIVHEPDNIDHDFHFVLVL